MSFEKGVYQAAAPPLFEGPYVLAVWSRPVTGAVGVCLEVPWQQAVVGNC